MRSSGMYYPILTLLSSSLVLLPNPLPSTSLSAPPVNAKTGNASPKAVKAATAATYQSAVRTATASSTVPSDSAGPTSPAARSPTASPTTTAPRACPASRVPAAAATSAFRPWDARKAFSSPRAHSRLPRAVPVNAPLRGRQVVPRRHAEGVEK